MFVEPDSEALIGALATMLSGRIMPEVDGTAQYYCQAALSMIARHRLARGDHRAALECARNAPDLTASPGELAAALAGEFMLAQRIEADVERTMADLSAFSGTFLPVPGADDLTAYIRAKGRAGATVRNVRPQVGGNSKQTIMFEVVSYSGAVEPMVLRRDHPNCYADTHVLDEYPIILALFNHGFPVPEPIWVESASPHIPGDFLISRRSKGESIGDYFNLSSDLAVDPVKLLAHIMVRLHAVDVDALGDPALARASFTAAVLSDRIDYWDRRYAAQTPAPLISMRLAFAWLRKNVAVGLHHPVVVHGDPGCHNILVEEQTVTALLDWEFGHVGSLAEDLAYCRGNVERFTTFEAFIEEYRTAGGLIPSDAEMEYYHVYRLVRSIVLFASATAYFNKGDNDDLAVMQAVSILTSSYLEMLTSALMTIMGGNRQ
jgi:aminoglycoside phosphotransferase (APT) family kinase protein